MLLAVMVISSCALMHGMEGQQIDEQNPPPPKRGDSTLVRSQRIGPQTATAVTMLTVEQAEKRPASAHPGGRRHSGEPVRYEGDSELQKQIREEGARRAAERAAEAQAKRTQGGTHTDE